MTNMIRILIADDHPIVREGLRGLIAVTPGMEVVAEAADGEEAIQQACTARPDVILLDLVMPRKDGLQAIQEIKQENPQARILVITSFAEDEKVFPAIKAGASGYLLKDSSPQELLQAIREVHRGEVSLHPTIARKLVQELNRPPNLPPSKEPLTLREMEVLTLLAQGLSNLKLAEKLGVSEVTVRTHIHNILNKLHLANRTQAALYALHEGLVNLDTE